MESGSKTLEVPKGAIVTALASELAENEGIRIVETPHQEMPRVQPPGEQQENSLQSQANNPALGTVVFGSDHGGFQLKESLKKYVEELGYRTADVGTQTEEPCDYPDFAYAVAVMVADRKAWRGVMIDGAGIGSCVVANKVPGIRAACCENELVARNAREHNDTNVLTLGSRVVGSELCKAVVRVWLETSFGGGRHKPRVDKISDVERRFLK
jgi:ribose 5-phosphate isomerase B